MELTSLATLAFLSQGETPASDMYGEIVEYALRALLRDAESKTAQGAQTEAILVWCLAEAYGLTRHPMILDAVRVQADRLDFAQATPWHAFAARALLLSGSCPETGKQGIAMMRTEFPSQTNDILNQATHAFLVMRAGDCKQATRYLEAVRALSPTKWRACESPLSSAVMLSTTLFWAGRKDYQEWHRTFYADALSHQLKRLALGWWTAESMGLSPKQLPHLAGSEQDVYVTCMILLTFPPPRVLPTFERQERLQRDSADNGEEIKRNVK